MARRAGKRCLRLVVRGRAEETPSLGEIGLFLYDLSTLYDLIRLGLDPAYMAFRFGKYPLYRGRRPLTAEDRLLAQDVRVNPVKVVARVGASREAAAVLVATTDVMLEMLESL